MRIKTKISLGLALLFAMFLTIAFLGIFNLHRVTNDMGSLLSDNFKSVGYAKNMLQSLDDIRNLVDKNTSLPTETLLLNFEKNLVNQENNITEIGEKDLTDALRINFEQLKKALLEKNSDVTNYNISTLNKLLYEIYDLNSEAIILKNNDAEKKAKSGIFIVSIVASFFFLASFTFLINFPGFIANPIKELTASIKQISNRNYDERLHFKSNDEFGELATAFNSMASRLYEYQNTMLAKLFLEKSRYEIIFEKMKDPVLCIDENNKILFVNHQAVNILGLQKSELVNKYAPEIALRNDLLRTILTENFNSQELPIFFENKESYFQIQTIEIQVEDKIVGKVFLLQNITDFKELDLKNKNIMAHLIHELKARSDK